MKKKYELELTDRKGTIPGKCPVCKSERLERIQHGQWACKGCRILFMLSEINQEEMIEWFVD